MRMPIRVLFKGRKALSFKLTKDFEVWVLSPLLIVVVIDSVLKKTNTDARGGIQWRPHQKLCELDPITTEIKNVSGVGLDALYAKRTQTLLRWLSNGTHKVLDEEK